MSKTRAVIDELASRGVTVKITKSQKWCNVRVENAGLYCWSKNVWHTQRVESIVDKVLDFARKYGQA